MSYAPVWQKCNRQPIPGGTCRFARPFKPAAAIMFNRGSGLPYVYSERYRFGGPVSVYLGTPDDHRNDEVGGSIYFNGADSDSFQIANADLPPNFPGRGAGPYTLVVYFHPHDQTTETHNMLHKDSATGDGYFLWHRAGSGLLESYINATQLTATTTLGDQEFGVCGSWYNGSVGAVVAKGNLEDKQVITPWQSPDPLLIGTRSGGGSSRSLTGEIYAIVWWDQAVPEWYLKHLQLHPWHIFEKVEYVQAGAAPGGTNYDRTIRAYAVVSDADARVYDAYHRLSAALSVSDAGAGTVAAVRRLIASLDVSDGLSRVIQEGSAGANFVRSISAALGVTDGVDRIADRWRTVALSVVVADDIQAAADHVRRVTDTLAVSDAVRAFVGAVISRTLADGFDLTDAVARTAAFNHVVRDTLAVTDAAERTALLNRSLAAALGVTDGVTASILSGEIAEHELKSAIRIAAILLDVKVDFILDVKVDFE